MLRDVTNRVTKSESSKAKWERIAASLPAGAADGIEQNAEELGLASDSDEFYAECIGQATA